MLQCKECGLEMGMVTNSHLMKCSNLTVKEYQKKHSLLSDIDKYYIFGRWCGDGCKTGKSLEISRGEEELNEMEAISKMLCTTMKHSKSFTTRFKGYSYLKEEFEQMYNAILHDYSKIKLVDDLMFSFTAGFLDSDGSVLLPDPNSSSVSSVNSIKIEFYNAEVNLLIFVKSFLESKGLKPMLKEPNYRATNVGVVDKTFTLSTCQKIDNYYLAYNLSKFSIHHTKKDKLDRFVDWFDSYNLDQEINISEIFYSIEGEGRTIGQPKVFIRVFGCPFECSFCDSKHSISKSKNLSDKYRMSLRDVISKVKSFDHFKNIEFTGGSPDWFPNKIAYLMIYFKARYGSKATMQVSGGLYNDKIDKLFRHSELNAFDMKDPRENIGFVIPYSVIRKQDEIKFLIRDEWSYKWVKETIKMLQHEGVNCSFIVTTLTENDTQDGEAKIQHLNQYKEMVERILNDETFNTYNVRMLPRLHVLLWGNKKLV